MLALYHMTGADFSEIKHELNLSDGALATHMKALGRDGLITTQSEHLGGRTRTVYLITPKGHQAIENLLDDFVNIRKAIPQ